jgi:beta-N-acetylhexosaminidase
VVGLDPSARDLERARQAARERRAASPKTARPRASSALKPPIEQSPIPFPAKRREEMAAYARRHYGLDTYRLRDPKVIVEHYTDSADAQSAIGLFTPDVADSELHELPNVCSHFVIDRDGTIYQLVPLTIMCRHTVGLNYTAIGIEHAGFSDTEVLGNDAELSASLKLTNWLRCRYGIDLKNVIGHNESLSSPYHRENVASLRTQTHGDWTHADMDVYRRRLARLACG